MNVETLTNDKMHCRVVDVDQQHICETEMECARDVYEEEWNLHDRRRLVQGRRSHLAFHHPTLPPGCTISMRL